jgi:sigma-54 dependent transcriptional regulator, acetoin dehydrogenase operon transcriptional activator AcoR
VGCSTAHAVDFNLICATHQDLQQAVEDGRFRADLFYRINGMNLRLPALRERTDIDVLCQRILKALSPEAGLSIAPDVLHAMKAFHWPGNLRQLSHALRAAVALLDTHECHIDWLHLPDDVALALQRNKLRLPDNGPAQNLHALSMKAIQQALENARGNVSAAARQLGISRQTLYRKLQHKGADATKALSQTHA